MARKKKVVSDSNDAIESFLSQDNDKSKVTDSAEKEQPNRSPKKQMKRNAESHISSSSSEEDGTALSKNKDKRKVLDAKRKKSKRSPNKKVKSYAKSLESHSFPNEEDSLPTKSHGIINTATQFTEENESIRKNHENKKKTSERKRKEYKPSSSKKIKSLVDLPTNHASSDEDDASPARNLSAKKTATHISEESDSHTGKDQSKKENVFDSSRTSSGKKKIRKRAKSISNTPLSPEAAFPDQESLDIMTVIEKECDNEKAFSDEDSSEGLPDIEKIFETLKEKTAGEERNEMFSADRRCKFPSVTKTSSAINDGAKSTPKKIKTTSSSKKSEPDKQPSSKDKSEIFPKHDKSLESTSKENDSAASKETENDKADTPVPDLGVKKPGRGRPKKPLSQSNSTTDKASSADGSNTTSKGEENLSEKQTLSDSGFKKTGRGRPRKSKLPAVSELNAKLSSNLSSQAELSSSRVNEDQLEENEPKSLSSERTNIGTTDALKETSSNPQASVKTNTESPVYAVKSKPSPKKKKRDEALKKSKKHEKSEKSKKPSRADNKSDLGTESDKNNSPCKINPKDSDEAISTAKAGEKRHQSVLKRPIYTSSDDSSDSEPDLQKPALDAKGKKLKREFSCHKCNAKFPRTQQLFDHTCEGKRDKGFACERCDKIYKLRSTYVNHKIIHSKRKPYKCGLCGKKSASQSNHLYHMKHSHPDRKPFPCEFFPCEKSYTTRREQSDHHKKHKRFVCPYCDEVFAKDSTLLHHKYKVHEIFFS